MRPTLPYEKAIERAVLAQVERVLRRRGLKTLGGKIDTRV